MGAWTFDYAISQARLVLVDNGKLHSHGFVCDMLAPIMERVDALMKERENNPGVWDDSPEWATSADVSWAIKMPVTHYDEMKTASMRYARELPKSRTRAIAEEAWADCHSDIRTKEDDILRIESAILKALAEQEAGKC